jgi:hypothetical protein
MPKYQLAVMHEVNWSRRETLRPPGKESRDFEPVTTPRSLQRQTMNLIEMLFLCVAWILSLALGMLFSRFVGPLAFVPVTILSLVFIGQLFAMWRNLAREIIGRIRNHKPH